MTNFSTQYVMGPVISPLVSKDKGDLSNRFNCAGTQLWNNAKTLAQDVVVLGGVAAGAKAVQNNTKFAKTMAKGTHSFANFLNKHGLKEIGSKLKRMPTKFKALAPIVALGTLAVNYITCKGLYKMGQIDQKYTDRATIEQHQKQII